MPPPVTMFRNKISVVIDGLCATALVDTGATISVMSNFFKDRIGRKVMFPWHESTRFRGVGGEILHPLGICTVNVLLAERVFPTEFLVLQRCTHDVILGIDFLQECGAFVDCGTGELSVSGEIVPALADEPLPAENTLVVSAELTVPPWSMSSVAVSASVSAVSPFDAVVLPLALPCAKKDILVPRCVVSINNQATSLWALNCSPMPVILPCRTSSPCLTAPSEVMSPPLMTKKMSNVWAFLNAGAPKSRRFSTWLVRTYGHMNDKDWSRYSTLFSSSSQH